MRTSTLVATVALAGTSVRAQNMNIPEIISNLPIWISQLPEIFASEAPAYLSSLDAVISAYAPTGAVSDLPGIFSSLAPTLISAAEAYATAYIPSGVVPQEVIATQIPSLVSEIVPAVLSQGYAEITQFAPPSAKLTDLPKILSSALPSIQAQLPSIVESAIPIATNFLSSYAAVAGVPLSTGTAPSGPKPTGTTGSVITTAPTLATSTSRAASATSSTPIIQAGAASSLHLNKVVAGVAGAGALYMLL